LLRSIAHVRFTWFNKCKRFAGLNFKCKLEVGLISKNCQLFSGRGNINDDFGFFENRKIIKGFEDTILKRVKDNLGDK
jgi:hypothetical protein